MEALKDALRWTKNCQTKGPRGVSVSLHKQDRSTLVPGLPSLLPSLPCPALHPQAPEPGRLHFPSSWTSWVYGSPGGRRGRPGYLHRSFYCT